MEQQKPTIEALAAEILTLARSRLTADLRFLSGALEKLPASVAGEAGADAGAVAAGEAGDQLCMATDGRTVYYLPAALLRTFRERQHMPARMLLHLTLHCLLGHPFQKQEKEAGLWSLACDIAIEEIIRQLDIPSCRVPEEKEQDEWRGRLSEFCPHMTAEELYNFLLERQYGASETAGLRRLFARDSHVLWNLKEARPGQKGKSGQGMKMPEEPATNDELPEEPPEAAGADEEDETREELKRRALENLRREWKQIARQAKADLMTFNKRHGKRAGALMDGLAPITFEECDYSDFLKRFGEQNEVMQLSDDEFDLIYYTYGLRKYGNIPLIEPLEYRDDKRIHEFVIAIDTSGSVQGDIVQSFLQKTCDVLRQTGSFTTQVEIYLIQCDAQIQSVERITSLESLGELIPKLKLRGFGGTDFRPVFDYVDCLLEKKTLTNLGGLLYFTDGVGTYPEKAPDYKTAFIFNRDDYISPNVPQWAIRAVLTTDNIRLLKETE